MLAAPDDVAGQNCEWAGRCLPRPRGISPGNAGKPVTAAVGYWTGAAVLLLASWCSAAKGATPTAALPQVDLGQTGFLKGEAGPGWLFETIGNGSVARYFTD